MRAIPNAAVDIVTRCEGCRHRAYRDSVGVLTIGYGHTGDDVTTALAITDGEAKALLREDLRRAAVRLEARIGDVVNDLTDNQYAALLSFVFNLGADPSWSIWRILKARQFDQVPGQMMRFVNAGGKKLQGLVNRRAAEVVLWSTDEPGSTETVVPSSVTRQVETPPSPMSKPLVTSKSFITTAATVAATAPVAVKQVSDAIAPYADKSETVAKVAAVLATIAALLAVAALVFQWLKHRAAQR